MAAGQSAQFGRRGLNASGPAVSPAVRPAATPVQTEIAKPGVLANLPWFTAALCGTLIFKFNTELRAATDFRAPFSPGHFSLLALGGSSRAQVLGQGEWWRLFTSTALHGSPAHLAGNLIALAMAGWLLEPLVGLGWFAAVYFLGALCGAVVSMLCNTATTMSVGASGAIMACLAMLYVLSYHDGIPRPVLRRRIAAALLFPALLPSVGHGAATDLYAHLGGVVAGFALAFALLASWPEDSAEPPGRSFAALIAGALLALTIWSFTISWNSYDAYASPGLDYVPPALMPRSEDALQKDSSALADKYPKDPRAQYFRGLYMVQKNDLAGAEPHLRSAIALGEAHPDVMTARFMNDARAVLALDLDGLGRKNEALSFATPLCPLTEVDVMDALQRTGLCPN